jgi:hypothetical protein
MYSSNLFTGLETAFRILFGLAVVGLVSLAGGSLFGLYLIIRWIAG